MNDVVAVPAAPAAPAAHMSDVTVGPPPGYAHSLADLQAEANEQYGMTRADTLAAAQRLYERGLITYPRVEERELPENMLEEALRIIKAYKLASGSREHDPDYRAPCWVTQVRGSHMAIMLTAAPAGALFGVAMTEPETRIYRLVHARFMSLFVRPAA